MARRQRGAAARSSSGKQTDEPSLTLPDSDDEAPEEVTFEDSKVEALRSMKQALDTARRKQKQPEDEAKEETGEQKSKKKKKRGKGAHTRNVKGNYTVTMLKDQSSTFFQQQTAEEFIQSRLYGPGSCRTTSNELLSLENKRAINKSAAVQFVKKEWACKEKAKAEKLKKRWIHKQQIPPC
ncbi:Nucleolar protein 7 [Larimichthys crocea]|uniref:Uncharacterized protein n=1 Tax=Larimichthys crocea TaxID=215358 RepID=A0ACD3QRG1_LARCR|nr:Nucleolar protein 7 [Larimichthys crocea]